MRLSFHGLCAFAAMALVGCGTKSDSGTDPEGTQPATGTTATGSTSSTGPGTGSSTGSASGTASGTATGTASGGTGTGSTYACTDDLNEPNDTMAGALQMVTGDPTLVAAAFSDDYWTVDVPAGQELSIDILFDGALGDLDVELYDGQGQLASESYSGTDDEHVWAANDTATDQTFTLRVFYFYGSYYPGACNTYELRSNLSGHTPCAEDGNEPNDGLFSALPAVIGDPTLAVTDTSRDTWRFDVPAHTVGVIEANFRHAQGDIDLELYDGAGVSVDWSSSNTDLERVLAVNDTGSSQSFTLDVALSGMGYGTASSTCTNYSLKQSDRPYVPCVADAYEPNDTLAAAKPIALGDNTLSVDDASGDYWTFEVPAMSQTTVDVRFLHDLGDIDVELFDDAGVRVDDSATGDDDEQVTAVNHGGSPASFTLGVEVDGYYYAVCNTYELTSTTTP